MSDFYSILKKSILDRGIADSGERDEIYAQARRAMIRRLWTFDPPVDEEEIEQRIAAFDVAVSDIEADVMAAFSGTDEAPEEAEDDEEPQAEAYRADPFEADGYEAEDREANYRAAEEDRPAAYSRRLPALVDPASYAQQVREAGLVRYYEEARRVEDDEPEEPPYDDDYDEGEADEPPAPMQRARALVSRRPPPGPPVDDPYESEPDYRGERAPPPRQRSDRWSTDGPTREAREVAQRQPPPPPRRRDPNDDLPRRRQRRRLPRQPLSDRDKIFTLLAVIGVCVLMLGGLGIYLLMPRDSGVTVDIDAHREVSDAATAVRLAAENMAVDQTFMVFDGRDPTIFETSPDNPVHFDATAGTVRVSSSAGSPGVKALIGPGLATRLAGHDVRVTIVARSSTDAGAAGMRFAYQSGVAISHWQTANLGQDYQAVALTWRVPALRTDRAGDLLVIQPGIPGDGTGADIKSIRIDLLASS